MKQPQKNAALYMRLSRDDESYGDSVSIQTQRSLLTQYANEHGFRIVGEYVDDGWSGTNFDRPEFQHMMDDIEQGKVNCVITKDLSRFGREHVMMDYYLEFLFPEKNVRYIAVTENEDTEKGLSDFVPFKNLFNEWYAKDTSRKIRSAFKAKYDAGQYLVTFAPIGYIKHPTIKNKLVVDEETSWIIKKIFDMAAEGHGAASISRMLRIEKIPNSGWINYQRSGAYAFRYRNAPEEQRYVWTIPQIKNILSNEVYIGNSVHFRHKKLSYKSKKVAKQPESEWYIVKNTHEPIIDKDTFDRVQKMIESRKRPMKNGTIGLFSGLMKCSDCGRSMVYCSKGSDSPSSGYFRCRKYTEDSRKCTSHYIRYVVIYDYVLSRIRFWSSQVQLDEKKMVDRLNALNSDMKSASQKRLASELKKAEKRKNEVDNLFIRIYEDLAAGRLTDYNFDILSAKYQAEQVSLDAKISEIKTKIDESTQRTSDVDKWINAIKEYLNPTELTRELLTALIEKIIIHQAVKKEDGTKEQEIEIIYRFVGKVD